MCNRYFVSCLLLSAVVLVGSAAALHAQDDGQGNRRQGRRGAPDPKALVERALDRTDKNKDGKIDKEELEAAAQGLQRLLAEADANEDNVIDTKELTAAMTRVAERSRNGPGQRGFVGYDRNSDKSLSKAELGNLWARVEHADENKDGAVSQAEYKKAQDARNAEQRKERLAGFDKADANKDGKLSKEEVEGNRFLAAMVSRADSDEDGLVSRKELTQTVERVSFPLLPPGGGRGGGFTPDGRFVMSALDKNEDGKIDKEELEAANARMKEVLADADSNKDGFITREEAAAAARKLFDASRARRSSERGGENRGDSGKDN